MAATYTFRDCLTGIEYSKELAQVRALFVLARHDIEMAVLYGPVEIVYQGRIYTKADIVRLTEYEAGQNVRVLLPEEVA